MSLIPELKLGLFNAWIFMSTFILQMGMMMCAKKGIWEKSHVPVEARKTKFENRVGGIANLVWLLALGYSIFLPLLPGTVWFIAGLVFFLIGLLFLILSTASFMTTPSGEVIKKGIYRYSRHPMYLGTFFICMGAGLAAASVLFVLLSVLMALFFHQEALIEERYCLKIYGALYQGYLNHTPRWLGIPEKAD